MMQQTSIREENVDDPISIPKREEPKHKCPKCTRAFNNVGHMKCHFYRVHSEFRLSDFTVPTKKASSEKLFCHYCDTQFKNENVKKKHLCTSSMLGPPYECNKCGKMFSMKNSILKHCQTAHPNDKGIVCDVCPRSFSSRQAMIAHRIRAHRVKEPSSECSNDSTEVADDNEECPEKNILTCDLCGETTENLEDHMLTHATEPLFECDVCSEGFNDPHEFNDHYRLHSENKQFVCDICNNDFTTKQSLEVHYQTHTNEKPYSCDLCPSTFITKQGLSVHKLSHKRKNYQCGLCDKKFRKKGTLALHVTSHKA